MALRDVLADLDMKVRGLGDVEAAEAAIDRFVSSARPAPTTLESIRIKSAQVGEQAGRLAGLLRNADRAWRANAAEIGKVEAALAKATEAGGDNAHVIAHLTHQLEKLRIADAAGAREIDRLRLAMMRTREEAEEHATAARTMQETTERNQREFGTFGGALRGFGTVLAGITAGVAVAGAAVYAFAQRVQEIVALGSDISDTAQRLGMTTRAVQEWRYVAEQSGMSTEGLSRAIRTLGRNAEAASRGAGPAAADLRRLGVSVRDAGGQLRSQEAIFSDAIAALAGIDDHTRRAAVAQRLFGESGAELLPLVNQGADGVQRLRERFRELGGGLSDDVVEAASGAGNALTDFRLAMTSLQGVLAANVLPTITRLVTGIATGIGRFVEFVRTSSALETVLGGLAVAAGVLAVAMFPIISTVALAAAPFVALFVVVEDLVTMFRGGDSVIGEFIDSLFGVGSAEAVVARLTAAWSTLTKTVGEAVSAVREFFGGGGEQARGFDGTGLTARQDALRAAFAGEHNDPAALVRMFEPQSAEFPARAAGGGGAGGGVTVHAPITVHTNDGEAAGRAASRELQQRLRDAVDILPAPEPA